MRPHFKDKMQEQLVFKYDIHVGLILIYSVCIRCRGCKLSASCADSVNI